MLRHRACDREASNDQQTYPSAIEQSVFAGDLLQRCVFEGSYDLHPVYRLFTCAVELGYK